MQTLARLMIVLAPFMSFVLTGCDGAPPPRAGAAAESSGPEPPAVIDPSSTSSPNRLESLPPTMPPVHCVAPAYPSPSSSLAMYEKPSTAVGSRDNWGVADRGSIIS